MVKHTSSFILQGIEILIQNHLFQSLPVVSLMGDDDEIVQVTQFTTPLNVDYTDG